MKPLPLEIYVQWDQWTGKTLIAGETRGHMQKAPMERYIRADKTIVIELEERILELERLLSERTKSNA